MDRIRSLHVPVGTRLQLITSHMSVTGQHTWRVWTGLKSASVPSSQYKGFYLELRSDGSVSSSGNDEELEVMEALPSLSRPSHTDDPAEEE